MDRGAWLLLWAGLLLVQVQAQMLMLMPYRPPQQQQQQQQQEQQQQWLPPWQQQSAPIQEVMLFALYINVRQTLLWRVRLGELELFVPRHLCVRAIAPR